MKQLFIIVPCCLILAKVFATEDADCLSLPKNLHIGAGSSAYQVEGAWNISGKGKSSWDSWMHANPWIMPDGSNGDIASNSYYKYKEDVQRIKAIGLDFYRFSVSWTRILPTGFTNVINKEGLQYYKNLTAELVANGIKPFATLYHWDHPQIFDEYGGWTNELMVDWFVSYARVVIKELGDNVKVWTTVNEPTTFCSNGYARDIIPIAPGKDLNRTGLYICVHNILKAHAKTYHMYDEEFRATQQGQVGIVNDCTGFLPSNFSDAVSADIAFQFICGWIGHPIYKGDYPDVMKQRIAMISEAEGYERSHLPEFSDDWISYIKGTADYFGMNHYTSRIISRDPDEELGIYNSDSGLILSIDPSWSTSPTCPWLNVYPPGLSIVLRKIRDEYNNPPVIITENGYCDDGRLEDYDRIRYHHDYLEELSIAINRDGCNVIGYFIWSLIDSLEWFGGYTSKFGIVSVDFTDSDRQRTAKLSTSWWTQVLKTRMLQPIPTTNYSQTF